MILVIIAVLMADTNTLTRTELDITVTMRGINKFGTQKSCMLHGNSLVTIDPQSRSIIIMIKQIKH